LVDAVKLGHGESQLLIPNSVKSLRVLSIDHNATTGEIR
jgi:hypothetical protein